MRPRVSATSREFSIATAAWLAKSRAALVGSATWEVACTAPMAPTSRSPYQRGMRLHVFSLEEPERTPDGASRQLSSELKPAYASTCSADGSPLPRVALTRPSVSNAQHTTPEASSIVRAWSAMLVTTLTSSWPASAASSWMRTDWARASSLAWCSRIVRRAMPTTVDAASRSLRWSGRNRRVSVRSAAMPPTTRSSCTIGTQTA